MKRNDPSITSDGSNTEVKIYFPKKIWTDTVDTVFVEDVDLKANLEETEPLVFYARTKNSGWIYSTEFADPMNKAYDFSNFDIFAEEKNRVWYYVADFLTAFREIFPNANRIPIHSRYIKSYKDMPKVIKQLHGTTIYPDVEFINDLGVEETVKLEMLMKIKRMLSNNTIKRQRIIYSLGGTSDWSDKDIINALLYYNSDKISEEEIKDNYILALENENQLLNDCTPSSSEETNSNDDESVD